MCWDTCWNKNIGLLGRGRVCFDIDKLIIYMEQLKKSSVVASAFKLLVGPVLESSKSGIGYHIECAQRLPSRLLLIVIRFTFK